MKLHIGTTTSGKDFCLPIDLVTQSVAILAKRGVGKTYTSAVLAEQLLGANQIPVIIDPTGAHWGLKSSADGKKAGFPVYVFGGDHADLPLEESSGEIIARALVENPFPAVLDVSHLRKGAATRFLGHFLEALYRLNRAPLHLICDEADVYAPQRPFAEEARTLGAMEDIVRRGRIKGIGCTLITQRPAVLNKNVLTQCEMLVAMRLVHPKDIDAIHEWVNVHGEPDTAAKMIADLPSLPVGTAWIWSPGWGDIFERVKINQRQTFDSSATPKPGQRIATPQNVAHVDVEKLGREIAATVERAKADDPRALRAEIARLKAIKPAPAPEVIRVEVPVLTKEERAAVAGLEVAARELSSKADTLLDKTRALLASIEVRRAIPKPAPAPRIQAPAVRRVPTREPVTNGALPKGERATLIGCAQYPNGVARQTLTVLTGYKRSSRDAYVQRLRERGYLEVRGDSLVATEEGIMALGADYQPLPTGDALLQHWMGRLPEGERKVLEVLVAEHPNFIRREIIDERTGYQRSSRDAYLQRLKAKRLVEIGSGEAKAADELFD